MQLLSELQKIILKYSNETLLHKNESEKKSIYKKIKKEILTAVENLFVLFPLILFIYHFFLSFLFKEL